MTPPRQPAPVASLDRTRRALVEQERRDEADWRPAPDATRWWRWREGEGWTLHERPTGRR